ncbi:MAG: hypothetical protein JW993_16580 [Sedimentisphaerales bacterium]|nr:hypothetical protein [Sedimentisphaerales bacterium]
MEIPGLVDLQVNGFKGVDFSGADVTEADVAGACRALLDEGTTAFLATLITCPEEIYARNLPLIARVMNRDEFEGRLLGIHLEGPFLSRQEGARGVHNPEWMKMPDIDYLERLIGWANGKIRLLTLAAELDGAEALARHATDREVTVSLGHQMADADDLDRLVRAGAKALTHLGNGVPAVLPRHENPIWAGLGNDDLSATIITDGHHLPVSMLKTIIRTKGPLRCIIVSDASPLAGLPPGQYESMGARVVLDKSGRLYNPITGYMVGSSATMRTCVDYLASLNIVREDELTMMAFENPLKLIGIDPTWIRPA